MTTTTLNPSTAHPFQAAAAVQALVARPRTADAKLDATRRRFGTMPEPAVIEQVLQTLVCLGFLSAQEAAHVLAALTTGTFVVLPAVPDASGLYSIFRAKLALRQDSPDVSVDDLVYLLDTGLWIIHAAGEIGEAIGDAISAIGEFFGL